MLKPKVNKTCNKCRRRQRQSDCIVKSNPQFSKGNYLQVFQNCYLSQVQLWVSQMSLLLRCMLNQTVRKRYTHYRHHKARGSDDKRMAKGYLTFPAQKLNMSQRQNYNVYLHKKKNVAGTCCSDIFPGV